jgi:hypothetical protein
MLPGCVADGGSDHATLGVGEDFAPLHDMPEVAVFADG